MLNRLNLPLEEIKDRYLNGESACSIAKDYNTSHIVIIYNLNKLGVKTRIPNKRKDIDSYIIENYPKGKTARQIAKELEVSHGTIGRHMRDLNIKSRGKPKGIIHHNYNPHLQFKDRCRKYIELATDWQQEIFKRDNYTCTICGKRGGDLNAHNTTPFDELIKKYIKSNGEDFEIFKQTQEMFDTSIGITLCKKCHYELHYGD